MTNEGRAFERITLIVLDSLGMGEMPDAAAWGDAGADTLGHICESREVHLPNLGSWGLGNMRPLERRRAGREPARLLRPLRAALERQGHDDGSLGDGRHHSREGFPDLPAGLPRRRHRALRQRGGRARHPRQLSRRRAPRSSRSSARSTSARGKPIVYTSADSVFQIAAHEEVIPVARLYEICETARDILRGEHEVGRVIARPFLGEPGAFKRTENRHDYAVPPPRDNASARALGRGARRRLRRQDRLHLRRRRASRKTCRAKNNDQSIDQTIRALRDETRGLIFSNLVDFDMLYGHRRDVEGYARALEHFDARLPEIEAAMREGDLLIITADHGNDPTYRGTDHTREYAPLLVYGPRARAGVNFGDRASLADIGQTIAENFGLRLKAGESFLQLITN